MKILYYSSNINIPIFAQTGAGTHIREMIAAFRENGHEVETLIMGGETEDIKKPQAVSSQSKSKQALKTLIPSCLWEGIKDWKVAKYDTFAQQKLYEKVEKCKPDLIYERGTYIQTSGVEVAKKCNIPHILEWNGPFVQERKALYGNSVYIPFAKQRERQQLVSTSLNVVTSTAMRDYFAKRYNIPKEKFILVPNAINLENLKIDPTETEILSKKYSLENQVVIGFVGKIMAWHGVGLLLEAFEQIHTQYPNIRLLIVGEGKMLDDYIAFTKEKNIADKVIFTHKIPHKAVFNHIALMDITVMANSNWYGSPVKIFEYGAMGKAIIAPDNVPVRDVMEQGKDGVLIAPQVDILVAALKKLIENESIRKAMASRFQQKILQHHTWQHEAARVLTAIYPQK